jgi:16S rRNA C1402 (ribose-2'-O) methylase RsmI
VAMVSDAGTPCISDPGAQIVEMAHSIAKVVPVPGPCAAAAAMSVSGAVAPLGFVFLGFLPREDPERAQQLSYVAIERQRPIILYEAPHRIRKTLEDLARADGEGLGQTAAPEPEKGRGRTNKPKQKEATPTGPAAFILPRKITICRELTKTHEQVINFPSASAALRALVEVQEAAPVDFGALKPDTIPILGEFTLVLHACPAALSQASDTKEDGLESALDLYYGLKRTVPALKSSDAIGRVAALTGTKKKELYAAVLAKEASNKGELK